METFLNLLLPIMIVTLCYLILNIVSRKDRFKDLFIKLRFLLGCIGIGVFLHKAYLAETISSAINPILLALLLFYGVVSLQNKYLPFRNSK
jgi:hypothetical protein